MSFWPFSNSLNNNSQIQKFLDSVQDVNAVSVEDLITDPILSQELISELHNIKGNYSNNLSNFQFVQPTQQSDNAANNSDIISITSSNNESNNNGSGKDARSAKLLEILLQPHILNGFLDHIVNSVEFFHKMNIEEEEKIEREIEGENLESVNDEVEIEQAENEESDEHPHIEDKDMLEDDTNDYHQETDEEKIRRYIQTSSDILSIDLWLISNRIIETPIVIEKLWSILSLDNLEESSPAVSYLVHILDQLMDANSIEFMNFIRKQTDLVDTFIKKIEIPMLMDFFLRVLQTDKPDSPTGILETLSQQKLIPKLINILRPDPSQFQEDHPSIPNQELFFKQTAATDFIKALVTISSNTALAVVLETNIGPNQLTRELASSEIINIMIHDIMLYRIKRGTREYTNKHGINNCVGIIIELIRKNNSDYDLNCGTYSASLQNSENGTGEINSYVMFQWLKDFEQNPPGPRDPLYLGDMLTIFCDQLEKFAELMDIDPIPPLNCESHILGFTKFKISELIAELLHCSNMILLNSKKIKEIIRIRDNVRSQQQYRLEKALNENITDLMSETLDSVTAGFDDISLADPSEESNEDNDFAKMLEVLSDEGDSEDEEPLISPENPFVCAERDEAIRKYPCVGDYFKIKLADSKLLLNIVSKFTQYPWQNFFHNVVFDLIQQIFNGKLNSYNSFLIVDLFRFDECNIIKMIVNAYRDNKEPRPGYMGHLILTSEEVVKFTSLYKPDLISPLIVQAIVSSDWEWFVNEVLLKTREVYNMVLGAEADEEYEDKDQEENNYGFDASAVGYQDLETYGNNSFSDKGVIILADKSNHELFASEKTPGPYTPGDDDDIDNQDVDVLDETPIRSVKIQNMSPSENLNSNDTEFDDQDLYGEGYQENEFLENLSGSSSSDEDDDGNELRRVPKHSE